LDFEILINRSNRKAFNLALRLTGNVSDAEDIVQDAYVRAWSRFGDYDPSRPFEAWLFRIITNRAIDVVRRNKFLTIYSLDNYLDANSRGESRTMEIPDPETDPEWIVVSPIMDERLEQCLAMLPARSRTALLLADVEHRSYQEIAVTMNCAMGTVRSRIYRARVALRDYYVRWPGANATAQSHAINPKKN
jgi:RNA polymerase sigma-70 factor (ECF subfamily)